LATVLTEAEKKILNSVVQRFLNLKKPTDRKDLLRESENPEAIDRLVTTTLLQQTQANSYLPAAISFELCGDPEVLTLTRRGIRAVAHVLKNLIREENPSLAIADIEKRAQEFDSGVDERMIRLGLFVAPDLGLLSSFQGKNEHQVDVIPVIINEYIDHKDLDTLWDDFIRRYDAPPQPFEQEFPASQKDHDTAPTQPSVYISYARGDEGWRDRITSHLRERGISVWDVPETDNDPNEALTQSIREKSRVFVLLLSVRYVDSDRIRRIEFPHIRSLTASGNMYIIDVVLEPCPWQSFLSLPQPTSVTLPEGGRTLSSGNEEQVKDDLQTLARVVRDAVTDKLSSPSSQEASRTAAQAQSPIDPNPLGQFLAASLTVKSARGNYEGMATLLSRSIAVIPLQPIAESGVLRDPNHSIKIRGLLANSSPAEATISGRDEERDFAVLRLHSPVLTLDPPTPLRTRDPSLGTNWQSFLIQASNHKSMVVRGTSEGRSVVNGKRYLQFKVTGPFPDPGIRGAPVVVEDQLVGVVAFADPKSNTLYAVSIGDMAKSVETEAIRELLPRVPRAPGSTPTATGTWINQETFDRFSPAARSILARANQLRNESMQRRIHTEHLLLALSEQPQSQLADLLVGAGIDLQTIVAPRLGLPDVPQPEDRPNELVSFPPVSGNVRRALSFALDRANADNCEMILASHITFGVLSTTQNESVRAVKSKGVTQERIRLPVGLTASVEAEYLLPGYQSDDATGPDLLNIAKDVEGLASVLAAHDVSPPLSLGLFGDWGTGKSFFMNQLEARIAQLQDDAKLANGDSAYCRNIVQIKFNAWNYIDCNLWASLTSEIFERLAEAIAQKRGNDSPEERALVLAAASSARTVLAEAELKKSEAEEELKKTEDRLLRLKRSEAEIEAMLEPTEVLRQAFRFAMEDNQVQKYVDDAARALRIPETKAAVTEVRSEILELQGTGNAVIFALKNERYLWVWLLLLGIVLAACWLVPRFFVHSDVPLLATRLVALLTALSVPLRPVLRASRKAIALIDKARASKQGLIDQKRKEQTDRLGAVREQVKQRVDAAHKAVEDVSARVKALNEQLEKMRADRRLADYIRQRHQSTDYTQHLGIISRVRADFRHLSILLREAREESDADAKMKERQKEKDNERQRDKKPPLFPPIDRIVLYIDDLDRCPEKNVVEVLQAVHLLLAFPLFVVIVGVDPRWLLHSLQQYSKAFQSDETVDGTGKLLGEESHWRSTPLNYLEKIFQIPFSLRPLDRQGFGRIVDALATREDRRQSADVPAPSAYSGTLPENSPASAGAVETPSVSPQTKAETVPPSPPAPPQELFSPSAVQQKPPLPSPEPLPPSTAIDRHPEHLQFRDWELKFMKDLHEFIPTPRAAKRFINIYRLLRASLDEHERAAFIGDEKSGVYQVAMLLLAILTGHPAEATEILGLLVERPRGTWWEFIASLKTAIPRQPSPPAQPASSETSKKPKSALTADSASATEKGDDNSGIEIHLWVELFDKLDRLRESMRDRSCQHFVDWAPRVARYSFQSNRILSIRRE
jgi:hypothetical protein